MSKNTQTPSRRSGRTAATLTAAAPRKRTLVQLNPSKQQLANILEEKKLGSIRSSCPNVSALYEYQRQLFGGYNEKIKNIDACFIQMYEKYNEKNVKDFLFKIDSIHDFTKERGNKNLNKDIIESLEFNEDDSIDKKVINDPDLETNIFFWFSTYVMRESMKDEYKDVINKMDFRPSIQEYGKYIDEEEKKYNFTLDAGLKEYNIFEALLTSPQILSQVQGGIGQIRSNQAILQGWYEIISDKFNDPNLAKDSQYYTLYSLSKNLVYAYENLLLDVGEFNAENSVDQIFKKYTLNEIKTKTNVNYNERLKAYYLYKKQKDEEEEEEKKGNFNILYNNYINYINTNQVTPEKVKKTDINPFGSAKFSITNELKISQGKKTDINQILTKNETFRVIAPQKFDANRTTGGGVTPSEILNLTNCKDDKKKADCSFTILEDTCYFYSEKRGDTIQYPVYIFEINADYPIKRVEIIDKKNILESYTQYEDIGRFKYDSTNKRLICSNAPGVTELTELYDEFVGRGYRNDIALTNILQIKRAGDYSQIWFCKKWNKNNNPKLFFMSNDRQSATFCLLEKVPYIGQISLYNVYFNPEGNELTYRKNININDPKLLNTFIRDSLLNNINEIIYFYDTTQKDDILGQIVLYLSYIAKYNNTKIYSGFEIDMVMISNTLITYINNKQDEEKKDACKTEIKELKEIFKRIEKNTNDYDNDETPKSINNLYNKIIEDYFGEDPLYTLNKKEIYNIFSIKKPYKIKEEEMEIDYSEEEKKLLSYGVQKISYPDTAELMEKLQIDIQEGISQDFILCDMNNLIYYAYNLYNKMLKKLKNNGTIYQMEIDEYKIKLKLIDDCIDHSSATQSIKDQIKNYLKNTNIIRPIAVTPNEGQIMASSSSSSSPFTSSSSSAFSPFTSSPPLSFAFSFENGLTYYKTYPSIPKKINTNKYKYANNVYVMDGKGYLKIEGSNFKGDIQLTNRNPKSVSYTDGTKISYYSF